MFDPGVPQLRDHRQLAAQYVFGQYLIVPLSAPQRAARPTSRCRLPMWARSGASGAGKPVGGDLSTVQQLTINPVPVNVNTPTYSYPDPMSSITTRLYDLDGRHRDHRSPGPAQPLWLRQWRPGPYNQSMGQINTSVFDLAKPPTGSIPSATASVSDTTPPGKPRCDDESPGLHHDKCIRQHRPSGGDHRSAVTSISYNFADNPIPTTTRWA